MLLLQLGLDISPEDMADFGIGGIGINNDDDDDEDDESLEAELAALQGESQPRAKKKRMFWPRNCNNLLQSCLIQFLFSIIVCCVRRIACILVCQLLISQMAL